VIDYRILPEQALIVIVHHAKASFKELLAFRERLHSDPQYSPDHDVINDVTNLKSQYAAKDVRSMAMAGFPKMRIAIIAPSDISFGVSRMWATRVEGQSKVNVCVFRETQAAVDWLGKEGNDVVTLIEELRQRE
jgi:hypothetical protein